MENGPVTDSSCLYSHQTNSLVVDHGKKIIYSLCFVADGYITRLEVGDASYVLSATFDHGESIKKVIADMLE